MKPRLLLGVAVFVLPSLALTATEKKPAVHAAELIQLDERLEDAFVNKHKGAAPHRPDPKARSFDWTQHIKGGRVRSQGHTGTCWIHSVVAALEYNWHLRNGGEGVPDLSPQPIIDRVQTIHGKPDGMAMDVLLQHGTADRKHYPFVGKVESLRERVATPYRIVGWGRVSTEIFPSVEEIKEALAKHGPLNSGIHSTFEAFHKLRGDGVFHHEYRFKEGEIISTHSILIVGWDDGKKAWKIQNSWGTGWGHHGFGWVAYGTCGIGHNAEWLRAQSVHYRLPREAQRLAGDKAATFPTWPEAREIDPDR